ncbi:hypothetical protein [Streptomyces chiangmaiensis]|uniref:FXSXX-COOH protein n=1 Tax=Streptomyces chiangmaiensis TaxID=766497 RepID=A0ABU7FSB5_9ACTN|nr:hypothetical protein [Streptomyces chiangmaiensis]MED7827006.1 hypothetical protein [Streptomyces chiangmaiensis]
MQQPAPARRDTDVAAFHPSSTSDAAGATAWESELADLTGMPLTEVESLTPLSPRARLLGEVLRARSSIRGGGGDPPGRAE